MRAGALIAAAATALALASGCAKIFGIDDPGVLSDGGVGEPCSTGQNATPCGPGLVCLTGTSYGQGSVCTPQCTADSQCAPGQGCLAVENAGGGSVILACAPNTSCDNGGCGNGGGGTTCSNGICRNTCFTGTMMGSGSTPGCPSDETCVLSCPTCNMGVCQPSGSGDGGTGSSSGGSGDGNAGLAPMPLPRTQVACAVGADNRVYVFGGMDPAGGATNDVQIYDPSSNSWSTGANMLSARYAAGVGAGQLGGPFFVVGGFGGGGVASNAMEQFGLSGSGGGSWSAESPMPVALGASAVAGVGQIFVAGGATSPTGTPVGTVQDWQLPGQWSSQNLPPMPTPRRYMATASPQGALLTIGGFDSSGAASNAVEQFIGTTWTSGTPMPSKRGKLAAATGPNDLVYVVGGANGGAVGDFASYQPSTMTWTPLPALPTPRAGLCAAFVSGGTAPQRLYAIGGEEEITPVHVYAVVEAFDPDMGVWIQ